MVDREGRWAGPVASSVLYESPNPPKEVHI
jgi:hypothetical protein